MIINHLENKIKKISKNLQFSHFVKKKIVSLQPSKKNSNFAIKYCFSGRKKLRRGTRMTTKTLAIGRAGLFVPMVTSYDLEKRIMLSSLFLYKKNRDLRIV